MAAGALYKSCGLLPEALQSLEAAVKAQPKEPSYKQAMAVVLTDLGEPSVCLLNGSGRGSGPEDCDLMIPSRGSCAAASCRSDLE